MPKLTWGYAVKASSIKDPKRLKAFKKETRKFLKKAQDIFKEEFVARTNPHSGTHIKSKRVVRSLKQGKIIETENDMRMFMNLSARSTSTMKIINLLEHGGPGGRITSKGKLMTVPKHLIPSMRGKAKSQNAHWRNVGGHKALVQGKRKRRYRQRKAQRAVPASRRILYWGKKSVKAVPKHFIRDSISATTMRIKKIFPEDMKVAWSAFFASGE